MGNTEYVGTVTRSGNYANGLEDGEMLVSSPDAEAEGGYHSCAYTASMGVRRTTGKTFKFADGTVGYFYDLCDDCAGWTILEEQLEYQWGIQPWGEN